MNRISILVFLFSIVSLAAVAQKTAQGKVVDASTNNPLVGATVSFPGKAGTTTDKDGMFTVDCDKINKVTVSFVGYESAQQSIKNCDQEIRIALVASGRLLDEVEITAISNQNKSLLYQPSAITKLSTTELKRGNGLFLDDAINGNVPGVTMNRRAVSSGQQFNIRGYGNGSRGARGISSNFDGQGYKVYLNGIPVTDAEGITLLDDIDFGSIGNVEVVKGPAGTLYGLAIAGVVNLETIKPEKGKTSIGQDVLIGNYGLQRYTTHFQMGGERSSLLVNYGHQQSDGFTVHNASHKDFVNIAGEFQPNARQSITAYLGYSNSYDERSGELTIAQYNANDYSGNIEYIKRNAHSEVMSVRAGLGHTYAFNNHISNTTTVFATGFNSNASSAGGWTDKDPVNFGLRSTFNTKFSLNKDATLSGITGVETQHQNAQTVGYTMVKDPTDPAATWVLGNPYWIIGASNSNIFTTTGTTSLFTEWTLALPHDLSITGGIGYSTMKIRLDDRFYNAATPLKTRRYDTAYKNMFSPHLAINKVFSKQFSVYASYSKAYKAPVSSYFFIPYAANQSEAGVVNRHLEPEIGNQFEIGTKGALLNGRLNYQLALFDAIFSKKMTTVAVPYNSTTTLYSYVVNGGKQKDKGIEALIKYTAYQSQGGFFRTITPFANLTYSDFKYGDNFKFQSIGKTVSTPLKDSVLVADYSGKDVAGVAKMLANIGVDLGMAAGLYANASYLYKDGFPITSDGVFKTSSYSLVNAKLGIRRALSSHFDIDAFFGINNIAGTKYPIMVFVNQIPDAYIAAPAKANYFGGINLKYIF
jgi:iron complex outermembrane receptor protein